MKELFRPIDGATLIFFRVFAGLLLTWELVNSLLHGDWEEYTTPLFHFSYLFLPWLKPLPPEGMSALFYITICAGVFVTLGLYYRISSILLFMGYTTIFLMEATEYINHLYFYSLLSFWMMWMPLHQEFSLDVKLGKKKEAKTFPLWMLAIILLHVSVAYFYAGVAKLNSDWLSGRVPELFLQGRGLHSPPLVWIMTYGGLLFDLFVVPFLLIRRTRIPAFLCALTFHLSNVYLFGLVTFPWIMILLTTLFFPPSWPRLFLEGHQENTGSFTYRPVLASLLVFYTSFQLLIPLRHHLHEHNPSWSEEGHQFSWRMKTRTKSGQVDFWVRDENNRFSLVRLQDFLTPKQIADMTGKPDLILQFAHFLRDQHQREGRKVKVFANSRVGLNGRPPQELIKPGTDLAQEERKLSPYSWILPMK